MKQATYIVAYRDEKGAGQKLFGPFVSDVMAARFCDELPEPVHGGSKTIHTLERFTFDEAHVVRDLIMLDREHVENHVNKTHSREKHSHH